MCAYSFSLSAELKLKCFIYLFILHALISVFFLLLMVSGIGCDLWLWRSLVFFRNTAVAQFEIHFISDIYMQALANLDSSYQQLMKAAWIEQNDRI